MALKKNINSEELINCLILCPTNLVKNWENEIMKWVPELEFISINPKSEQKDLLWEKLLKDIVGKFLSQTTIQEMKIQKK